MPSRIDNRGNLVLFKKPPELTSSTRTAKQPHPDVHPMICPFPPPRLEDMHGPVVIDRSIPTATNEAQRVDKGCRSEAIPPPAPSPSEQNPVSSRSISPTSPPPTTSTKLQTLLHELKLEAHPPPSFSSSSTAPPNHTRKPKPSPTFCTTCRATGSHRTETCFLTHPAALASFLAKFPEHAAYWREKVRRHRAVREEEEEGSGCRWCGERGHVQRECAEREGCLLWEG